MFQPNPAVPPSLICVYLDTITVFGGEQQQAGVLAGRDLEDEKLNWAGCDIQQNTYSSPNRRLIESSISKG